MNKYYSWKGPTQEKSAGEFLQELGQDGAKWASEFKKMLFKLYGPLTCEIDEGWLIGWFANAIEAGRGYFKIQHEPIQFKPVIQFKCNSVTDTGYTKEYNFTPFNTLGINVKGITPVNINIIVNSDSDVKFDPKIIYDFIIKEVS